MDKKRMEEYERNKLALPIGISEFRKAVSEYYYVDKTLMIKEFLDTRPQVTLFTRPRRFGKTLNMDMLRTFFEISEEDTMHYFEKLKIWSCGEFYRSYQGKFPVIFMTFKDVKFSGWEETLASMKGVVQMEFLRHNELRNSGSLTAFEKEYYEGIMDDSISVVKWSNALAMLSQMLHKHYGSAPVILIDEYDVPLQQGHMQGFYEEAITFLRNFFSAGVKDNPNLSYAFMTGVLRVAKESIFSGMNNLKVHSILDERYGEYFGFTAGEVKEMLSYYGVSDKYDEICEWYDGYQFGGREIFNPWSVINYVDEGCFPKAFWQSTGSNDIIGGILEEATPEIVENLKALMQGKTLLSYIDTDVAYPQVREKPSSIYSFLLVAGYLKTVKTYPQSNGDYMCEVAVPNKEIFLVYSKEILSKLTDIIPQSVAIALQQTMFTLDAEELQSQRA